jgi:tRNA A37 threonylcarbamoyladenosine synthetase subunit TsaC/SUA5/YrdC
VARGDGAVGLRSSSHPLARAFARRLAREGLGPATATSLNRSGEPPAQSVAQARALCGDSAEEPRLLPIEGAEAGGDAATTVVDLTGARPEVLRWGALREEELAPHLRAEGGA